MSRADEPKLGDEVALLAEDAEALPRDEDGMLSEMRSPIEGGR
jgi:hypothetical protein